MKAMKAMKAETNFLIDSYASSNRPVFNSAGTENRGGQATALVLPSMLPGSPNGYTDAAACTGLDFGDSLLPPIRAATLALAGSP